MAVLSVHVVETIYQALPMPGAAWLEPIAEVARRSFASPDALVGDVRIEPDLTVRVAAVSTSPGAATIHDRALARANVAHDGTLAGMMTAAYRMFPPVVLERLFLSGPTSRLTRALAAAPVPLFEGPTTSADVPECSNALGLDASGVGLILGVPSSVRARPSARAMAHIAGHLAAAHRLRRAPSPAEAVVDRGVVVHAEGEARDPAARASLRDAARRMDRARTAAGGSEGAELWTALVEGRWSLVEQYDADGRRLLVARRNEPPHRADRRLTVEEQKVVALVALGRAQKYVAYELGIGEARVSKAVRDALRKLGVSSRQALVELHGALSSGVPSAAPPERARPATGVTRSRR